MSKVLSSTPIAPRCVGPNTVIQLGLALREQCDEAAARAVFRHAGLEHMLEQPPDSMVDQHAVAGLFDALFAHQPTATAKSIATLAGTWTADYLLANRIPGAVQLLLKILPTRISTALLLNAIAKNAWTFAGSGHLRIERKSPIVIEIAFNPIAMPECPWHVAVFSQLFRTLVSAKAEVLHTKCCAKGASVCRFEIDPDCGK